MDPMRSSVQFLLPFCVESQCDIFFNVIKQSIERTKVDDLVNSVKLGMGGGEISIKPEDVSTNWNQCASMDQQIRQAKILGHWAIANFPALGKKFYGASWHPPIRKNCHLVGQSQITTDQIDAIVFKKLKLRLFHLNDVSPSTVKKLRHLAVPVPDNIGKQNECEISSRIKSFEISDEWSEKSWGALKFGKFSMDFTQEQHVELRPSLTQPPSESNQEATIFTRKRVNMDGPSDNDNHGIVPNSVSSRKRPNRDNVEDEVVPDFFGSESIIASQSTTEHVQTIVIESDVVNEENVNVRHEDPEVVTSGQPCVDSMQVFMLEMRQEMGQLKDLVRNAVIKQKDDEIASLRASSSELLQAKDNLINDHQILKERSDEQSSLIIALQKGVDAISKLQTQSENDLSASLVINEQMKEETMELKTHIQNLNVSKDAELSILANTNQKLQEELKLLQEDSSSLVCELKVYIEALEESVATAEKSNLETIDENRKLQQELLALNDRTASKDIELTDLRFMLSKKQCSNMETQTDITGKEDKELQVEWHYEYGSEVQVQTDAQTTKDVEIQVNMTFESRMEIETQRVDIHSEYGKEEVPVKADIQKTRDVERQADLPSESRKKIEMPGDPGNEEFETDDPIVIACRGILLKLRFGWMKFSTKKNAKFSPGFVYPPDSDGKSRAQKVNSNGYPSNTKFLYFNFNDDNLNLTSNDVIPKKMLEEKRSPELNKNSFHYYATFEVTTN